MRFRRTHSRVLLLGLALVAAGALSTAADAQGGKLRFGVGPLQPTPSETKKASTWSPPPPCSSLRSAVATGVTAVASLHQVHLARAYADRIVVLRNGKIVEDATASRLDARTIELIYERNGERSAP